MTDADTTAVMRRTLLTEQFFVMHMQPSMPEKKDIKYAQPVDAGDMQQKTVAIAQSIHVVIATAQARW